MNIPLDNLYHWIRGCTNEPVSIYTFKPHGSKNIVNLSYLETIDANAVAPEIVCHDQEPLNFELHRNTDIFELWTEFKKTHSNYAYTDEEIKDLVPYYQSLNFYSMIHLLKGQCIYDRYVLLHSEKNSTDIEKFSQTSEPVYYWCHGIIARDWYRFAEHDPRLNQTPTHKKTFLVYCRAWTSTREYRLKFLESLIQHNLIDHCQVSVLHTDQEIKLNSYVCSNPVFQPGDIGQLTHIINNSESANASADYCAEDFVNTDISVVLETVADGKKIHLTEKILRPIACGHPFMLVAGPNSLDYLRSYGFKTFSPWIDESYDQEQDLIKRIKLVSNEMTRIENLSSIQKRRLLSQLKKIAMYNKQHFFSNKFFDQIQSELVENLNTAIDRVKITRGHHYFAKKMLAKKFNINHTTNAIKIARKAATAKVLRRLRQNPSVNLRQIVNQYPPGFFNV